MGNSTCPELPRFCIQVHFHQNPSQIIMESSNQKRKYVKKQKSHQINEPERILPNRQKERDYPKRLLTKPKKFETSKSYHQRLHDYKKQKRQQKRQPEQQDTIKWVIGAQQNTQRKYFIIGMVNNDSVNSQNNSRQQNENQSVSQYQQESNNSYEQSQYEYEQQDEGQYESQESQLQEQEQEQVQEQEQQQSEQEQQNYNKYHQQSKVHITQNPENEQDSVKSQQKSDSNQSIHLSKQQFTQLVSRIYIALSQTQS